MNIKSIDRGDFFIGFFSEIYPGYMFPVVDEIIQDRVYPSPVLTGFKWSLIRSSNKAFNATITSLDGKISKNASVKKHGDDYTYLPFKENIDMFTNRHGIYVINVKDNNNIILRFRVFLGARIDDNIIMNNVILTQFEDNVIRYNTDSLNRYYFVTPMIYNYQMSDADDYERYTRKIKLKLKDGNTITKTLKYDDNVSSINLVDKLIDIDFNTIPIKYYTITFKDIKLTSPIEKIISNGEVYNLSKESSINIDNVKYNTESSYINIGSQQKDNKYKLTIVETDKGRHVRFKVNFKDNGAQVPSSVEVIFGNTQDNSGAMNADLKTANKGDSFVETSLIDLNLLEMEVDTEIYPNFDTSKMTLEVLNDNDTNEKVLYNFILVDANKVNPPSSETDTSNM